MKKILTDAVAVANAASRAVTFNPRSEEGFNYYGARSNWVNSLFTGGYEFMTPPPEVTEEGVKPYPSEAHASSMRASGCSIWPPASRRRCACV